ncbi:ROK family transcriptional regulator [Bifidobacterium magnum]|uniref:Transcriptional regulator, ROK family n=1 Tax=Bifidobacterium magnum TaxID=1692 RepID=A0A087BBD3_9BIFI|nr:ROK family transcriptional regulator [Bifidobacterium magnum]KFI68333.1 Transcriptional regulator, ROK family [Bifidobacterium magnum]
MDLFRIATPAAASLKHHHRTAIASLLYRNGPATKQQIAEQLHLSLPTVIDNLGALEERGIVVPGETQPSTGGRKPRTYAYNADSHIAVGVELAETEVVCSAVNLYGTVVAQHRHSVTQRNDASYVTRVGHVINDFVRSQVSRQQTILGISLCGPEDMVEMFRAHAGLKKLLEPHTLEITNPCEATAMTELWSNPDMPDTLILHIADTITSTLIVGGAPLPSSPDYPQIGHMTLVSDHGKACECGRTGCFNTYCSIQGLPEEGESLPGFFSVLEQGEIHHRDRMMAWLGHVAQAVANVQSVLFVNVVISGPVAQYLDEHDMQVLQRAILAHHPQTSDMLASRQVRTAHHMEHAQALGAALGLVARYLQDPYKVCE